MRHFSIGYQVLVAVVLGIFTGLFFGPLTGALNPIGSAYTMLLQMAVLPYITFSLIHGLGSITPTLGKKLFKSGWPYLLTLWVLIFALIYLLAVLIPESLSPLIKSDGSSEIESEFTNNFLTNLIPQNPFYDVLNNIVPAVAIFGLISGIALMHVKKKEPLIDTLERINQTIEKILTWLGLLAPIGAYVYISIAFGTIHFEDLIKLEMFVFAFILSTLFVTFWILPTLLATLTPLSYKEALKAFRYVCLLPFVTGLSTAAIPFLNSYLRKLSQKHETHERFRETSQTILPIAYSFGHIGNAMTLFLILFFSYYYRHPFNGIEKILISILTIPLSIGSSTGNIGSILFLIKQLGFPEGASEFYLEIKSFTYNFQVLMSIASVLTLILLTIYSYYGLIRVKWKHLSIRLATPLIAFALVVFAFKAYVHPTDLYQDLYMKLSLSEALKDPITAEVHTPGQTEEPRTFSNTMIPEVFSKILSSRVLRVGFFGDSIPYCYFNDKNELVGFDVSYAYELARDLECKLEFIPFDFNQLAQNLTDGVFDIGMSSIIMSEERLLQMQFTFPYLEDNNALVVPRLKKKEFLLLKEAQANETLKIGAGGAQYAIAKRHFPKAHLTRLTSISQLTRGEVDAILWSETSAVIWCLTHPDFIVIDYGNQIGKSFFGYPIRQHATDFGFFLNNWLTLKEQSGFKKDMEAYWIHGIPPGKREPRWSILRNVLHWN
jgi:proton glutamate symport protein